MINRSLGNLLRRLTKEHGEAWDAILPQAEFSYNDSVNRSTGRSPFQIVYGTHPRSILGLRDIQDMEKRSVQVEDFAEPMRDIHQQVKEQLEHTVNRYKKATDKKRDLQFQVGDMVMVYLRKERLPKEKHTKLMMKKMGQCKVLWEQCLPY